MNIPQHYFPSLYFSQVLISVILLPDSTLIGVHGGGLTSMDFISCFAHVVALWHGFWVICGFSSSQTLMHSRSACALLDWPTFSEWSSEFISFIATVALMLNKRFLFCRSLCPHWTVAQTPVCSALEGVIFLLDVVIRLSFIMQLLVWRCLHS